MITKRSNLFVKTQKNAPADEVSKNAQLLIRAGYVYKEMAGAYVYLPPGLRVFNKVVQIIREEMDAIGGNELFMTALQRPDPWEASGRWSEEVVDVWFKTKLATGQIIGLANTHEEAITDMMRSHIRSYKDLPVYAYQFQTKFRNELRSKSGIMRGREFIMKDLYSFALNKDEHDIFYEECKQAYLRVFERVGLGDKTFVTFASGGSFSKFSHEFQTICDAGEDIIYLDRKKNLAVNEEVYTDEVLADLNLKKSELEKVKAAEVGNIFTLGTKYSDALGLHYTDEKGNKQPVFMGSYGIGPGRTMGVVVESLADDKGLVWPMEIAPYQVCIVAIGDVAEQAEALAAQLDAAGVEVLYDDRVDRPGEKFADVDLMGIPIRLVVSDRLLKDNKYELKLRTSDDVKELDLESTLAFIRDTIHKKA